MLIAVMPFSSAQYFEKKSKYYSGMVFLISFEASCSWFDFDRFFPQQQSQQQSALKVSCFYDAKQFSRALR